MENKEIKYCLCTEGTDKTFAHLRVMLSSFLKNNPWFNGDIVINTFNLTPLSKQNMETLQKLDDRILFREVDSSVYRATLNGLNRRARNNKRIDTMSELIYCYSFEAFELDEYDAVLYINHLSLILGDVSKLMNSDADLVSVIESNVFNDAVENHPRTTDKSHTINSNIMLLSSNILKSDMGKRVKTHLLSVRSFNQNTHKKLVSAQVSRSEFPIKLLSNSIYSKKTFFPDKKSDDLKSSIRDIAALELNAGVFGTTRNFHGMGYKEVDRLWMKESEGVIDKLYGKEGLDSADKMSQYVGSFRTRINNRSNVAVNYSKVSAHVISNVELQNIKLKIDTKREISSIDFNSTIIIGSGRSCMDHDLGKTINKFKNVVRFRGFTNNNDFSIVGKKVTELCFNDSPESISNIIREYQNTYSALKLERMIVSHNRDVLNRKILQTVDAISRMHGNVKVLKTNVLKSALSEFLKAENIEFDRSKSLTSGLLVILDKLFIDGERHIYIHGFDAISNNSEYVENPYHYYDKDTRLKDKLLRLHDMKFEKKVIEALIKNGRITNLIDAKSEENEVKEEKSLAFISVVDSTFVEGFLTMIQSLYENNPNLKQNDYLIVDAGLSEDDTNRIRSHVENVIFKKIDFSIDQRKSKSLDRLKSAYFKFYAYNNSEYDRLVILDCDMLVVGAINTEDILNVPDHTISACNAYLEGRGKTAYLNSGFVIVPKGMMKKDELISSVDISNSHLADQGPINKVFNEFNEFNKAYNVEKRIANGTDFKVEDAIILHYVGEVKPWHPHKRREKKYNHVYLMWDEYNKKLKQNERK